jgi:hypothetical protein
VRRRWIDCGTFTMERSPRIRPERGLISFCLSRRDSARSLRTTVRFYHSSHAGGALRLSHSDDRRSSPTAEKRDDDKNHRDDNQNMSNPGGFTGDAKGPQCLGNQGNNKKDDCVF